MTPQQPPDRKRWYYPGWTMLAISAVAQYMSAPGQSYSVAAFKEPMREALHLSETQYSLAYGFATVVSGAMLPITGRLVDRFGARIMLPLIAMVLALGCIYMSTVDTLPSLYIGFAMVRCLGQGALTLISAWIVGEWFLRKRGFATALAGLGGSISVMTIPMINGVLIEHYGWRFAWPVLGTIVGLSLALPSLVFLRNRPEEIGLEPDGQPWPKTESDGQAPPTEISFTVTQALVNPTFWKLLAVPISSGMVGTGMVFHQVSLLGSRGVSAVAALGLISLQAAIATVVAIGAGWLSDRVRTEVLLAAAMCLLAASVLVVWWMPFAWMAVIYAGLMGLHGSILRSAGTVVWVNYFGRQNQGAIRGVSMAVMILSAAIGPLPLALSLDYFGSYDPALILFALVPFSAMGLVLTARDPRIT